VRETILSRCFCESWSTLLGDLWHAISASLGFGDVDRCGLFDIRRAEDWTFLAGLREGLLLEGLPFTGKLLIGLVFIGLFIGLNGLIFTTGLRIMTGFFPKLDKGLFPGDVNAWLRKLGFVGAL